MDISARGVALITGSEGKKTLLPDGRYKAYLDMLAKPPVWTIYKGLTKGVREGMIITEDEGERMFAKECTVYEDAIERLVMAPLNQNQFDALVSFVYNVGPGSADDPKKRGFYWSSVRRFLNEGKYDQVPAALMRWTHAGGVEYPGLVTRRKAEGALFMEPIPTGGEASPLAGEGHSMPPPIPQRVEEAKPSVVTTVKESPTIWASFVAMMSTIGGGLSQGYEWIFGVAREAGPEVLALKTTISPFDALVKLTPAVLLMITVAAISYVVIRKISKR